LLTNNDLNPWTAVVAAMPEEMAPLRARVTEARPARCPSGELTLGHLRGRPVALLVTGDGARNARQGMAALLGALRVDRLLAIGVAGALSPDLGPGAMVIGERVLDTAASGDGDAGLLADRALVERIASILAARAAVVVTSDRIADSVAEKQRLLLRAARAGGQAASVVPAVVDLESAAYAGAAARAGIPWLVLRAVSDTAGEALPALLNRSRDEGGAVRRTSVVRGLLGDPSALPVLLSLRRRVRDGAETLARAVEAVLPAWGPSSDLAARQERRAAEGDAPASTCAEPGGQRAAGAPGGI
jgi:adenosylhomocysteine nucleosidase